MAGKYLGQESFLTKKFLFYVNRRPEKLVSLTFESVEEPSQKKSGFTFERENDTQEESFEQNFEGHKKDFRIKKKTHHRNFKSQIEFGNGRTPSHLNFNEQEYYETVERMREMEENLHRIQDLREKYRLEKQMIESDYNYIRMRSHECFNPQSRMLPNWTLPTPSSFTGGKIAFSGNYDNFWHGIPTTDTQNHFAQSSLNVSPTMHNNQNLNIALSKDFCLSLAERSF